MIYAERSQFEPQKPEQIFIENDPMTLDVTRILITILSDLAKSVKPINIILLQRSVSVMSFAKHTWLGNSRVFRCAQNHSDPVLKKVDVMAVHSNEHMIRRVQLFQDLQSFSEQYC